MIPSSGSSLSVKGHGQPASSLSRPVSRSTSRLSSGSTPRPASSLSTRPGSSASATTRPQSRFSVRPHSRHARSRLIPSVQKLVFQVTGLQEQGSENDPDGESFQELVDHGVRQLETSTINKATTGVDMGTVDKHISGHALKARINTKDALAEALETAYQTLKTHIDNRETDLDQEIKTSHIPDHLQFLLALNQSPTDGTVELAKMYLENIKNPPLLVPELTWADILAEEPFEGEHWEGVFTAPNDGDEWDSSPSLSPLNSDDLALDEEDDQSSDHDRPSSPVSPLSHLSLPERRYKDFAYTSDHREQFERLRSKQYWREDWHDDTHAETVFNIDDPSTLGPTVARVLARNSGFQDAHAMLQPERYIHEDDMVREVLLALQGNKNIIFFWLENSFKTISTTPRLNHLSLVSQASILASLAHTATTVELLRRFSAAVFKQSFSSPSQINKPTSTRTCEAFADAIDEVVRGFDSWCSAREEAMCRASAGADAEPLTTSLMGTERAIRDQYETSFEVILSIVYNVFQIPPGQDTALFHQSPQRRQPAAMTACLLDVLFSTVQEHVERCETVTSDTLMRVFVRSVEPTWEMLGKWLRNGMGTGLGSHIGARSGATDGLDDEFFIESSGVGIGMMGMGLLDPDFWNEGYALREVSMPFTEQEVAPSRPAVPLFLEHVAQLVLGTGKAVGLLTALGELPPSTFTDWKTFGGLVNSETQLTLGSAERNTAGLFSVSIDTLSRLIFDNLLPQCQTVAAHLVKVLVEDCFLWKHVGAIEDLFLMRKGDAVSHFIDVVFTKMDSPQPWADFHFLNAAFSDVVDLNLTVGAKEWINPSLVRFSYRGGKDKDRTIKRRVKAIDGLAIEYALPFPLTYIFPPKTIHGYGEVFIFLMQIRRAKNVLERILARDEHGTGKRPREELKVFYAMRSRLSWFTNTLLNFITTYVIHAEVCRFHEAFRMAKSLDDMIQIHDGHLDKIRGRCLLKQNTSALQRTIISILDMCLHFSEGFVAFSGDTTATFDVSRQSVSMKRHRSRRQRRNRKNVIGFSQYLDNEDESSDDDENEGAENDLPEPSYSTLGASTNLEEDFSGRVEKMSAELDSLVRFLRRGVESLAGGSSEAAPAFGVLAFSLEDWDL